MSTCLPFPLHFPGLCFMLWSGCCREFAGDTWPFQVFIFLLPSCLHISALGRLGPVHRPQAPVLKCCRLWGSGCKVSSEVDFSKVSHFQNMARLPHASHQTSAVTAVSKSPAEDLVRNCLLNEEEIASSVYNLHMSCLCRDTDSGT